MKTILTLAVALMLGVGMIGCSKESGTKVEKTVTTPEGSATTTNETKVETSGDPAPAALPADAPAPVPGDAK